MGKKSVQITLVIAVLLVSGTWWITRVPNELSYKTADQAFHFDDTNNYDFGILEFSELGNLFNRELFDELLALIERRQKEGPVALFVFVHGWNNNSSSGNVADFHGILQGIADLDRSPLKTHRIIGVYVGWRGISTSLPVINYLTFWERKTVAQKVGQGGFTEVLAQLQRTTIGGYGIPACSSATESCELSKNRLIVLSHSFGGAIVFNALNQVFIDRLVNAARLPVSDCEDGPGDRNGTYGRKRGAPCVIAMRFAHAVVLLNPAVEANQFLPLKELMSSFQYPDEQDALMHILSSEADHATRWAFPFGQALRNLFWDHSQLIRSYDYPGEVPREILQDESSLTAATVGNYAPFRTGFVGQTPDEYYRCWAEHEKDQCGLGNPNEHIPIGGNEPIQILQVDESLIASHSDVFNCKVQAYVLALIQESAFGMHFGWEYRKLFDQCTSEK